MTYMYKVTFANGSTITVVAGTPISAAEAAKRATTVSSAKIVSTVPLK